MRLAESSRTIERHGEIVETRFSINNSRKAFSVLSSLLYRDKISAIVRELSCNAYDAHVAVGKTNQPFTVHLPNVLEPYFSVRDEGSGLSPNDIETIYTTYFASTKTESNDFIGALGLGSKSPFSYVDSFTVSSRFNGIQYNYAAFISEEGEPKIARMSQQDTDEPNGLEVSLPIKHSNDFNDFANKASIILARFKPQPIVVGHHNFRFGLENNEVLLAGNGWHISKIHSNAIALMGCVAYPIVPSAINTLSEKAVSVLSTPLEIEFPIGTLDVTAGREDLSYDKTTLVALEQRVAEILAETPTRFQQEFDRCETEYEARLLYGKLFAYGNPCHKLLPSIEFDFSFKGKSIKSNNFEIDMTGMDDFYVEFYSDPYAKHKHRVFKNRNTGVFYVTAHQKLVIIDNNLKKSNKTRILFDRKNNPGRFLLVLHGKNEHKQAFIKQLEGVPVEYMSALATPPRAAKVTKIEDNAFRLEIYMAQHRSEFVQYLWKSVVLDFNETFLYVHKRGIAVVVGDQKDHNFLNILRESIALGLITEHTKVYGLNSFAINKAKKAKWQHFYDYIRDRVITLIVDPKILLSQRIYSLEREFEYLRTAKGRIGLFAQKLPSEHPIKVFYDQWNEATNAKQHSLDRKISSICSMLNIKYEIDSSLADFWESLLKTYQMLHIFRSIDGSIIDYDHLVKYVEWVDQNIVENHS